MVASAQELLEFFPGLVAPADPGQCVNVPECAYIEGSLRSAEIVGIFVTLQMGPGS
jgi:hypothetical protein